MKNKIVIIGAGAAGMAAAGFILREEPGSDVTIVDKNNYPGKKLGITGKGRCNLTNNCSPQDFLKNVVRNSKFLYSSIYGFSPENTVALFEDLGVPLKTERGNRVFPVSDKALDIVNALKKFSFSNGAKLVKSKAEKIILSDEGVITGVGIGSEIIKADIVILASGGATYPSTGADSSGVQIASKLGHTIIKQQPSLVPLSVDSNIPAKLMGLSLKNVTLKICNTNKTLFNEQGEMLFTHYGLSGPLVLSASSYMEDRGGYTAIIDLKPALSEDKLDERIRRDFSEELNKNFGNSLSKLVPSKLIPVIIELSEINPDKKVNSITKEERKKLVSVLKNFTLPVTGKRGFSEAIITRGGVDTGEINPKTMESKIIPSLFFAGEIIDVDALTGGFNLQIAFSTSFAAAKEIIKLQNNLTIS